jgi:integrase
MFPSVAAGSTFYTSVDEKQVLIISMSCTSAWLAPAFTFGGLRSSEILRAEWEDVRHKESLLAVRGSKGRHGGGMRRREIPLFGEIAAALEGLRAERPGASGRIVLSYSDSSAMGVLMGRIIHGAGLTDWERPFQNLRATRSTELIQLGTPIHNYCRWLGHSIQVALRHYAQTRPEDVQRAVLLETMPLGEPPESPCSAA